MKKRSNLIWLGSLFLTLSLTLIASCFFLSGWQPASPRWLLPFLPATSNNGATYTAFAVIFGLMGLCCFGGARSCGHLRS